MWQSFSLKTRNLWQNIHFQLLRWKFLQKFSNPTNYCSIPLLASLKSCFLPEARSEIQNFFCCTHENQLHRRFVIRELHTVSWNCTDAIRISVLFCSDFSLCGDLFPKIILCRIFLWNISDVGPFTSLWKKAGIQLMYVPPQLPHG